VTIGSSRQTALDRRIDRPNGRIRAGSGAIRRVQDAEVAAVTGLGSHAADADNYLKFVVHRRGAEVLTWQQVRYDS
jgi:hypothetical protein